MAGARNPVRSARVDSPDEAGRLLEAAPSVQRRASPSLPPTGLGRQRPLHLRVLPRVRKPLGSCHPRSGRRPDRRRMTGDTSG